MDFYSKFNPQASSKQLVIVGKITSCIIIIIAALWAPQIGKFGSLLKYYQEMLSYMAPPIVATFLLGIFSRRVNGQGAFLGLLAGLLIGVCAYLFKQQLFGNLHFLLIVPFLFVGSAIVTYACSLFFAPPKEEKLKTTTFKWRDTKEEIHRAYTMPWYKNYFIYAQLLVIGCIITYVVFA